MPRNMHGSKPAVVPLLINRVDETTYRDFLRWAYTWKVHPRHALEMAMRYIMEVYPLNQEKEESCTK